MTINYEKYQDSVVVYINKINKKGRKVRVPKMIKEYELHKRTAYLKKDPK